MAGTHDRIVGELNGAVPVVVIKIKLWSVSAIYRRTPTVWRREKVNVSPKDDHGLTFLPRHLLARCQFYPPPPQPCQLRSGPERRKRSAEFGWRSVAPRRYKKVTNPVL